MAKYSYISSKSFDGFQYLKDLQKMNCQEKNAGASADVISPERPKTPRQSVEVIGGHGPKTPRECQSFSDVGKCEKPCSACVPCKAYSSRTESKPSTRSGNIYTRSGRKFVSPRTPSKSFKGTSTNVGLRDSTASMGVDSGGMLAWPKAKSESVAARSSKRKREEEHAPRRSKRMRGPRLLLTRVLGEGGFGLVFEASLASKWEKGLSIDLESPKSLVADHHYALKLVDKTQVTAESIEEANFLKETSSVTKYVVRLFDTFETAGHLCFLMEKAVTDMGSMVKRVCQDTGRKISSEQIKTMFYQVFAGLEALHDLHIIHRDIKPANLLIDPQGVVKLADFGLAVKTDSTSFPHGKVGTAFFMAPEVMNKKSYGKLADIFSVGVTLFWVATLKVPFLIKEEEDCYDFSCNHYMKDIFQSEVDLEVRMVTLGCIEEFPISRPTASEGRKFWNRWKDSELGKTLLDQSVQDRTVGYPIETRDIVNLCTKERQKWNFPISKKGEFQTRGHFNF